MRPTRTRKRLTSVLPRVLRPTYSSRPCSLRKGTGQHSTADSSGMFATKHSPWCRASSIRERTLGGPGLLLQFPQTAGNSQTSPRASGPALAAN